LREWRLFDRCDGGDGDFDRRRRNGLGRDGCDSLDFDFGDGSGRNGLLDRFLGNEFGFRGREFFGFDLGYGRGSGRRCLGIQEVGKVTAKLGEGKWPKRGDARIVGKLGKSRARDEASDAEWTAQQTSKTGAGTGVSEEAAYVVEEVAGAGRYVREVLLVLIAGATAVAVRGKRGFFRGKQIAEVIKGALAVAEEGRDVAGHTGGVRVEARRNVGIVGAEHGAAGRQARRSRCREHVRSSRRGQAIECAHRHGRHFRLHGKEVRECVGHARAYYSTGALKNKPSERLRSC
jgi:hypothetical protein